MCDRCPHSSGKRKAVWLDGGGSVCAYRSSSLMQQGRNRQWQPEMRQLFTRLKAQRMFSIIRFIERCKGCCSFLFWWCLSLLIRNICGMQPVNRKAIFVLDAVLRVEHSLVWRATSAELIQKHHCSSCSADFLYMEGVE